MKYALAALAVVAGAAALFFRPPPLGTAVVPTATAAMVAEPAPDRHRPAATTTEATLALRPPSRSPGVVVYVAGEVRRPGVYAFAADQRAVDALARAGGPLPDADLVAVNLAAILSDGDEIAIPKIGASSRAPRLRQAHAAPHRAGRGRAHSKHTPRRHTSAAEKPAADPTLLHPIDLNTADEHDLEHIPGIGPGLAGRIVAYRKLNGPFGSLDELADVSGITPRIQDALGLATFVR